MLEKIDHLPLRIVVLLLSIALFSCSRLGVQDRLQGFDDAIRYYGAALRWKAYQEVHAFHVDQEGEQPDVELEQYEQVRVTSINITRKLVNRDQTEVLVVSEVGYYLEEYGILKKMTMEQVWWYDKKTKKWLNAGVFPPFELQ